MRFIVLLFLSIFCFANEELLLNSANSYIMTKRVNKDAKFFDKIQKAKALIVFPSVKKIGFLVGGMSGDGLMIFNPFSTNRTIQSVSVSGGSLGLQVGYKDSALVIFVMKDNIIADIKDSKIIFNAEADYVAGGISNNTKRKDDKSGDYELYYTNGGFFAGASFGGAIITLKDDGAKFKTGGYAYKQLVMAITTKRI